MLPVFLTVAGTIVGKPKFKDGSQNSESLDLKYNFKTEKDLSKRSSPNKAKVMSRGKLTKKMYGFGILSKDGWYTTLVTSDHHFYVRLSKAKMIRDKKVVSGFANLYIDVPFLCVPFGSSDHQKGTSGIIMPTYGEERMRGFNLRGRRLLLVYQRLCMTSRLPVRSIPMGRGAST